MVYYVGQQKDGTYCVQVEEKGIGKKGFKRFLSPIQLLAELQRNNKEIIAVRSASQSLGGKNEDINAFIERLSVNLRAEDSLYLTLEERLKYAEEYSEQSGALLYLLYGRESSDGSFAVEMIDLCSNREDTLALVLPYKELYDLIKKYSDKVIGVGAKSEYVRVAEGKLNKLLEGRQKHLCVNEFEQTCGNRSKAYKIIHAVDGKYKLEIDDLLSAAEVITMVVTRDELYEKVERNHQEILRVCMPKDSFTNELNDLVSELNAYVKEREVVKTVIPQHTSGKKSKSYRVAYLNNEMYILVIEDLLSPDGPIKRIVTRDELFKEVKKNTKEIIGVDAYGEGCDGELKQLVHELNSIPNPVPAKERENLNVDLWGVNKKKGVQYCETVHGDIIVRTKKYGVVEYEYVSPKKLDLICEEAKRLGKKISANSALRCGPLPNDFLENYKRKVVYTILRGDAPGLYNIEIKDIFNPNRKFKLLKENEPVKAQSRFQTIQRVDGSITLEEVNEKAKDPGLANYFENVRYETLEMSVRSYSCDLIGVVAKEHNKCENMKRTASRLNRLIPTPLQNEGRVEGSSL